MFRKVITLLSISLLLCGLLCACTGGNYTKDNSYEFSHAHVDMSQKILHFDIHNWSKSDNIDIIWLYTKDNGVILTDVEHVLLYTTERCPICNK